MHSLTFSAAGEEGLRQLYLVNPYRLKQTSHSNCKDDQYAKTIRKPQKKGGSPIPHSPAIPHVGMYVAQRTYIPGGSCTEIGQYHL